MLLASGQRHQPIRDESEHDADEPDGAQLTVGELRDFGYRIAPGFRREKWHQPFNDKYEAKRCENFHQAVRAGRKANNE
jgi:hypothetical protein